MTLQQLDALRDQLKNEMSGSSPNLQKVGQLLTQAKVKITNLVSLLYFVLNTFQIALIELGAFVPIAGKTDPHVMISARKFSTSSCKDNFTNNIF